MLKHSSRDDSISLYSIFCQRFWTLVSSKRKWLSLAYFNKNSKIIQEICRLYNYGDRYIFFQKHMNIYIYLAYLRYKKLHVSLNKLHHLFMKRQAGNYMHLGVLENISFIGGANIGNRRIFCKFEKEFINS